MSSRSVKLVCSVLRCVLPSMMNGMDNDRVADKIREPVDRLRKFENSIGTIFTDSFDSGQVLQCVNEIKGMGGWLFEFGDRNRPIPCFRLRFMFFASCQRLLFFVALTTIVIRKSAYSE